MTKNILRAFFILSICILSSCSLNKNKAKNNIVIGISSALGDTEWSQQMIDNVKNVSLEYPFISNVIIENTFVSPNGQIDQIKKLISEKCDIIIIDSSHNSVLTPIVSEAVKKGIIVIATGIGMDVKGVINVCLNQKSIAEAYALWLSESISGYGEIIAINGVATHPLNKIRIEGYRNIFNSYPNIKLVQEVNCDWDNMKAIEELQKVFAKYNKISGIFVQENMCLTVGKILKNKGLNIPFTGEAYSKFLEKWSEDNYNTIAIPNPPGYFASAMRIGILLSQGRRLKQNVLSGVNKNTIYLPAGETITKDNLQSTINKLNAEIFFYVDSYITKEEAEGFFE